MKFTARVTRDIVRSESATLNLRLLTKLMPSGSQCCWPLPTIQKIWWNHDNIDEVRDVEVLSVEESDDDGA